MFIFTELFKYKNVSLLAQRYIIKIANGKKEDLKSWGKL